MEYVDISEWSSALFPLFYQYGGYDIDGAKSLFITKLDKCKSIIIRTKPCVRSFRIEEIDLVQVNDEEVFS